MVLRRGFGISTSTGTNAGTTLRLQHDAAGCDGKLQKADPDDAGCAKRRAVRPTEHEPHWLLHVTGIGQRDTAGHAASSGDCAHVDGCW